MTGRSESVVLGSVSAEVVESNPCRALVVRTGSIGRLVLGDDGSADAAVARQLLSTTPGFQGLPVRVVGVSELSPSWYGWLDPAGAADTQAFEAAIAADRDRIAAAARRSAALLTEAGLDAEPDIRAGDAGHELVAAASEFGADLIVIGRRSQARHERLLGSVARKVLWAAPCSVLVVPSPTGHEG